MNFKQIIQDYFTFSRNERKGLTILLAIIFVLAIANKIIFYFETPAKLDAELLNANFYSKETTSDLGKKQVSLFLFDPNTIDPLALDSLALPEQIKVNMIKYREKGGHYYSPKDFRKMYGITDSIYRVIEPFVKIESVVTRSIPEKSKKQLFNFDPNTAGDSSLFQLGFTDRQIKTIRNYQSKGGYFDDTDDFFKIYGISASQKRELAPYINIQKRENWQAGMKFDNRKLLIEINSTDFLELMKLPGIGTTLSKRIIKYRDLLGGFYTFDQLKEVYGIQENTIDRINEMIKVDAAKIQKVDLNFSDRYELAKHPYIGKEMANQIIRFRTRYGKISDPSVLKDSMVLEKEAYEKLKPYL